MNKETAEKIVELRYAGHKLKQIAQELGVPQEAARQACIRAGVKGKPWKDMRDSEIRAYKAQGHTNREVADRFDISLKAAETICRGIAPQKKEPKKLADMYEELEAYAKETTRLKAPGLEYAGEYSGSDGFCKVRCKTCGAVFYKSFVAIRKGTACCHACRDAEINKRKQAKAEEKAEKILRAERERQARAEEKRQEKERKEAEKAAKVHPCAICGAMTTNPFCCSTACSKKRTNQLHEVKRRMKLVSVMVDKDITLEEVYRRDNGICYLCGEPCDWEDKQTVEGTIVCGGEYPSIDHVKALAKGGFHAWDNVRLAHRRCNWEKNDSDIAPPSFFS